MKIEKRLGKTIWPTPLDDITSIVLIITGSNITFYAIVVGIITLVPYFILKSSETPYPGYWTCYVWTGLAMLFIVAYWFLEKWVWKIKTPTETDDIEEVQS